MKLPNFLIILLGLSVTTLFSQSKITGTEVSAQKQYSELDEVISSYNIYEIKLAKRQIKISSRTPFLDLKLGDKTMALNLFQNNLELSYKEQGTARPLLLGGSLRTGGTVSLTVNDDFIYGFIRQGSTEYFIEPLSYLVNGAPANQYIFYNVADVKEDKEHVCGVNESMIREKTLAPNRVITTCKVIELAIANTYDMVTKYGNTTATENHNLGVLNNVQTNYRSEFDDNIEFDVIAHYFPTSAANNPLSPQTSTTDASTLLSNFTSWAENTGSCPGPPCWNTCGGGDCGGATGGFGIDYNMAQLWTDRNIAFNGSSGTVGLAYTPGWHHLLEDYTTSGASLNAMVSHEMGHNFDASHDGSGSNFIMAPSVTLTDNWSSASKTDINARLATLGYLANCSTLGAPTANFFKGAIAICSGSSVEFEDQSQYGATRSWSFTGGTPATSTDEKPSVTYNTPGLYAVELTSTNATGSDTHIDYVDIEPAPATPCTPSGGTGGSGGITLVRLENLSHGSSTSGLYDDNACTQVASLTANTAYTLTVGVQGVTRLRYFVDFNNDGDFLDTDESSGTFSFSGNGNLNVGFDTPASPVLETLLRMRVTVSTNSTTIANTGCTAPSTGQVEDYSIYFPVAQVFGCTDPNSGNYNPNATVDDGSCGSGTSTWYADTDNDNFGDANNTTTGVTAPTGYIADDTDCDDTDATVFPGALELCDGKDNDCDGLIDEGLLITYYEDNDDDDFGNPASTIEACTQPAGYVLDNTDCDDNDAAKFPGNPEVCDGKDNDCDGLIDEGVMNTYYADTDGDDFGDATSTMMACTPPTGFVLDNTDCDDTDAAKFPGNPEVCDGKDNDCDGLIDEGVMLTFYEDSDNDNYGNTAISVTGCTAPTGFVSDNTDCNDSDANINPGATEICDGLDNDCDGLVDEGVLITYYEDSDSDGFGNSSVSTTACTAPSGYVTDNTDCDDNDGNNFPGNTEICDGQDNDCDGLVDEGGLITFYEDSDSDGYGNPNISTLDCIAPTGYVLDNTDCDDNNGNKYPGNTEICDGLDNDCDGLVDEGVLNSYYPDNDNDGYYGGTAVQACTAPAGHGTNNTDCNDTDANINPGAAEICDGIDNNCNGVTDEGCSSTDCDGSYLVINIITQNTYRAGVKIESGASISGGGNILFTAGSEIELEPGFEVVLGTDFEARIEPCNPPFGSGPAVGSQGINETATSLMASFAKGDEVGVTIRNNNNSVLLRGHMAAEDISLFISDHVFVLDKGAYLMTLTQGKNEITQDILVIK